MKINVGRWLRWAYENLSEREYLLMLRAARSDQRTDRTKLDRALNGRHMAALALNGTPHMSPEDYEGALSDALANLMHFAERYGLDFEEELLRARSHHAAEDCAWDEVPDA